MQRSERWACVLGLAALNAPLGRVAGIAGDALGNVYLCDRDNSLVLKVDRALTVFAGSGKTGVSGDGGPATAAALNSPATCTSPTH